MRGFKYTTLPRVAFTLVEVLVVIGVIAVLIAVLMPALARAREAGRRTVCLSNLRQLTIAWNLYSDDNKGFLVLSQPTKYQITGGKLNTWVAWPNDEAATRNGALWKYLRNSKVYHCPSDADEHFISYSINSHLRGAYLGVWPAKRHREIRRPTQTFVFIDHNDLLEFPKHPVGNNGEGFLLLPQPQTRWITFPGWWHNRGACLSFVDGHVEYWQWTVPQTLRHDYNDRDASRDPRDLQRLQSVRGESP